MWPQPQSEELTTCLGMIWRCGSSWLLMIITHSKIREPVLMVLAFLRVMGFPFSWKKLAGPEMGRLRTGAAEFSTGTQRLTGAMARGLVHETPP